MFLEKTSKNVKGYLEITVFGFFIERFLNLAMNSNISIWEAHKVDDATVILKTNIKGYKKLSAIANKTGCKMRVSKKNGIPFYILRHKKRKVFAIFFLLLIAGIYYYNLHIWNIDIIGDFTFPIEEIKKELEEENIKIGVMKKRLDTSYIKNNIYMRRHDIAWIGISFKGTNCTVEVVEANLKEKEDELDKVPCNILADKSGIVYSINVLEGNPMVQVGDMIFSGDVLISGVISSDWSANRYVNAKGQIYIKTWYTNKEIIQLERDIISHTGNVENNYSINIKNYQINLGNKDTKFEKYDTIVTENRLNLFGIWELPITFTQTSYQEIDVETVKYTEEQAINMAIHEMENTMLKKLDTSYQVIHKDIKTKKNENNVTIVVTIECIEEVGIKKKLEG